MPYLILFFKKMKSVRRHEDMKTHTNQHPNQELLCPTLFSPNPQKRGSVKTISIAVVKISLKQQVRKDGDILGDGDA